MTGADFKDWMDAAQLKNAQAVIHALGVGRTQAEAWVNNAKAGRDIEVKRTVALAMAAIVGGLKPWPEGEET